MDMILGTQFVTTLSFGWNSQSLPRVPAEPATQQPIVPIALPAVDVLKQMLSSKRASNKREVYIVKLRQYISRFAAKHPNLATVTTKDVETWLAQFPNQSSRATWLSLISTLFGWCVKRELLLRNPCQKIEKVKIDRGDPVILTIEQSRALMAGCPLSIRPYLTLALFAGIRPDEILRMDWSDVNLETKTVRVNEKTRRRRIVPLEPIAVELLSRYPFKTGSVAPSRSTVRRWIKIARELLGGIWTPDILRHTAASMLLAKYQDAGKVATMLGNSPQILLTHYNNPVTPQEAEKFWSIMPPLCSINER